MGIAALLAWAEATLAPAHSSARIVTSISASLCRELFSWQVIRQTSL